MNGASVQRCEEALRSAASSESRWAGATDSQLHDAAIWMAEHENNDPRIFTTLDFFVLGRR